MSIQEPQFVLGYDVNNPEQSLELLKNIWAFLDQQGVMPKDALNFSDEMMEDLYQMAHHLYNTHKLKESLEIFRYLTSIDFKSYRYAFGSAACCHQMKDYKAATAWYTVALVNDPANPMPAYFAMQCNIELEQWGAAKFFCKKTIELAADKEEFKDAKEQAMMLKPGIEKKASSQK
jgi:type III secretion system low calcium response chaperone LcrH/SycD